MFWIAALYQHLAGMLRAARAAGHLHDGLRQPFRRAEVGAEQALVRVQHHHQRHVRKVMPLGQHLRADQDAGAAAVHPVDGALELPLLAQHIAIEAFDGVGGEPVGQCLLHAFGAMPQRMNFVAAARATFRQRLVGAAVMAGQPMAALMHRHARIAAVAGRDPATTLAQQGGCIAAAVQVHQHLGPGLQMPLHGLQYRRGNSLVDAMGAHVDQRQAWRLRLAGAFGQQQMDQPARRDIVQAFK